MPDWHAYAYAEMDATLGKWLMLDRPSRDARPLAPVPESVLARWRDLPQAVRDFCRRYHGIDRPDPDTGPTLFDLAGVEIAPS